VWPSIFTIATIVPRVVLLGIARTESLLRKIWSVVAS
jgi:hypothetical protein